MDKSIEVPEQVQFLYSKEYKEIAIIDEKEYFDKIKKGLEELPIDERFYKTIESLIRFFKFSFLIYLKRPFEKINSDPKLFAQYEGDVKKIAKIAQDMIGPGGRIYELDFLFEKGIDHTFYKKIEIKEDKRKVIEYFKKLSESKKKLQEKVNDQTITEDDIMQFHSHSHDKDLRFLDDYLENLIKVENIKEIEEKCQKIKLQRKNLAKKKAVQLQQQQQTAQQQSSQLQPNTPSIQPTTANPLLQQQPDLEDIPVCCRRFFLHHQIIYQPQSINIVYRQYPDYFKSQNHFDILRTVCGLLNSEGGFLFIGVKEDRNTYKKEVEGYTIIEKDKVDFRSRVDELVDKCIQPSITHDMLKVVFVPIKHPQTNKYISGKYLIKICVRFGQRKEFYSFKEHPESRKELFAVRTDNDTKIITSGQEILNIYKNRVLETPPDPAPIHKEPCPKPEVGRPLYEAEEFVGKK